MQDDDNDDLLLVCTGYPTLYRKFLSNMHNHHLERVVYPFALPSIVAARVLTDFNWRVDLIYIDSAHELGETLVELTLYYALLRPGGLLMGDDYEGFPAVAHDVQLFALCKNATVVRLPNLPNGQWLIHKPEE
jgi:hypothetical protein